MLSSALIGCFTVRLISLAHCNDWSKTCGSMCSKIFNRQNQTGKGQWAKTGIAEAGQRPKQYQAEVGVTGSEFQGRQSGVKHRDNKQ